MIDKEKIEKGLRCCIEGDHCNSTDCPYYDAAPNIQGCTQALCQDVLNLLKEQDLDIETLKNTIQGMVEGQAIIAGDRRVDVVRCRDCKRGEKLPMLQHYPNLTWCNKHSTAHNDDWFCADGERTVKSE